MNVVFLDFDGVINTPIGYDVNGSYRDSFNYPSDGRVNNYNAICLLNKLCREQDLAVVVSSKGSWRYTFKKDENGEYTIRNYRRILYDSGLDDHTYIYGHTPATDFSKDMEIKIFLEKHPEIEKFIILDDCEDEISDDLKAYLVLCDTAEGFTEEKYKEAVRILKEQKEIKRSNSYQENR